MSKPEPGPAVVSNALSEPDLALRYEIEQVLADFASACSPFARCNPAEEQRKAVAKILELARQYVLICHSEAVASRLEEEEESK